VRLHRKIRHILIWRFGMFSAIGSVSAFIRIDIPGQVLRITLRGEEPRQCIDLMLEMIGYVESSSNKYSGVVLQQCIASPYKDNSFISLTDCIEDNAKPTKDKTLKCKATRNIVNSEEALVNAGIIEKASKDEHYWWKFRPDSKWTVVNGLNKYCTLKVFENDTIVDSVYFERLCTLIGGNPDNLVSATVIFNDLLITGFEFFYKSMLGRTRFRNKDIQQLDPLEWEDPRRSYFEHHFIALLDSFLWNRSSQIKLVPAFHGVNSDSIDSICQNGFACVATTDEGFYGKGIYFTSDLEYASQYAKKEESGVRNILVALLIPGDFFPVVEHPHEPNSYYGKAAKSGVQSHYTLVKKESKQTAYPIDKDELFNAKRHANEVVVFQDSQALPLFLLKIRQQI